MNSTKRYDILGVPVDALTMDEAARAIIERAGDHAQPPAYVVKPYVEFLDSAHNDAKLRQLLSNAWLSLPDAISLQWAATYLYGGKHTWWRVMSLGAKIVFQPKALRDFIPEKFGGATFTWRLLEASAKANRSIYLVGSPKGTTIEKTAAVIRKRLPNITIAGTLPGELSGQSGPNLRRMIESDPVEAGLLDDLKRTKPDIILVGMGYPLQELLMAKLIPQVSRGLFIGEGGTFDYDSFGGVRKRAPQFIQHIGLEWLWRLILEPTRLQRQLAIPRFIWAVYRSSHKR